MARPQLKPDSIFESLLEIRFASDDIPEIIVGKLAALPTWSAFGATQLPIAQMPLAFRRTDPNLAFLPTLERKSDDGKILVRIGERVLSFHRMAPYPSWGVFGAEIMATLDMLYDAGLANFKISRFGLRYVNTFTLKDHGIRGVNDLNIQIAIGKDPLNDPYVLSIRHAEQGDIEADVRLAAKELVANPQPADQTAFLDLDFHTPENFECTDLATAKSWVERAHEELDKLFLRMLTDETKERLLVK